MNQSWLVVRFSNVDFFVYNSWVPTQTPLVRQPGCLNRYLADGDLMQMHSTYGIFDHEADHIVALVRQHLPLAEVLSIPCPACGSKISVSFNDEGTGFKIVCHGDPLHMTKYQEIDTPPAWWKECVIAPTDTTWYWREWHEYDGNGTLRMKMSGWTADDIRWSGELECPVHHPDYKFWQWVLERSGFSKDLIDDTELEELRSAYKDAR